MIPHPPRPLVLRPRLFDVLDRGLAGPLTLICAPPGAGKTALLSSWIAEREPEAVAWLSVRPGTSAGAFWAEWLEGIKRVAPSDTLLAELTPPRGGPSDRFVVQLLNGFADLDEPVTVVIDDFHEASRRGIAESFAQLLHAAPDGLRLGRRPRQGRQHQPLSRRHDRRRRTDRTDRANRLWRCVHRRRSHIPLARHRRLHPRRHRLHRDDQVGRARIRRRHA